MSAGHLPGEMSVEELLGSIDLQEHVKVLTGDGWDSLARLVLLTEDELTRLGIPKGHQRHILSAIAAEKAKQNPATRTEGWLLKQGGGSRLFGRKNMKRRFFVLEGSKLSYYKSDQQPRVPLKQPLDVKGCQISSFHYYLHGQHTFIIRNQTKKLEGRSQMLLVADSAMEQRRWVRALKVGADPSYRTRPPTSPALHQQAKAPNNHEAGFSLSVDDFTSRHAALTRLDNGFLDDSTHQQVRQRMKTLLQTPALGDKEEFKNHLRRATQTISTHQEWETAQGEEKSRLERRMHKFSAWDLSVKPKPKPPPEHTTPEAGGGQQQQHAQAQQADSALSLSASRAAHTDKKDDWASVAFGEGSQEEKAWRLGVLTATQTWISRHTPRSQTQAKSKDGPAAGEQAEAAALLQPPTPAAAASSDGHSQKTEREPDWHVLASSVFKPGSEEEHAFLDGVAAATQGLLPAPAPALRDSGGFFDSDEEEEDHQHADAHNLSSLAEEQAEHTPASEQAEDIQGKDQISLKTAAAEGGGEALRAQDRAQDGAKQAIGAVGAKDGAAIVEPAATQDSGATQEMS
eukprot:g3094.t1